MKSIVLLTAEYRLGQSDGNELLASALKDLGFHVKVAAWDAFRDEGDDAYVLRSTWNYTEHLDAFLAFCRSIAPRLINPLPMVEWNCHKGYLLDLADKGLPVLPMHIVKDSQGVQAAIDDLGGHDFVAKPAVSASAQGLVTFTRDQLPEITGDTIIQRKHAEVANGEASLMYFGGEYSHAALKTPQAGEIRCQSGFGGTAKPWQPPAEIRQLAEQALSLAPGDPVYARVDIIPGVGVIELELIEPGLFFDFDSQAAARCAAAIAAHLKG